MGQIGVLTRAQRGQDLSIKLQNTHRAVRAGRGREWLIYLPPFFFPGPVILKEAVRGPSPSFLLSALILVLENNVLTEMSKAAFSQQTLRLCKSSNHNPFCECTRADMRAHVCVQDRNQSVCVLLVLIVPIHSYSLWLSAILKSFFLLLFQMRGIKRLRSSHLSSSPLQTAVLHTPRARSHPTPASNNKALALRIDLSLKDSLADTICSVSSERN